MNCRIDQYWRRVRWRITFATIVLTVPWLGCASDDSQGPCAWLYAPPSFVDAGASGCTAEPSGLSCDRSNGKCSAVCQPNEYLLTCGTKEVGRMAIPEQALLAPMDGIGCQSACTLIRTSGEEGEAVYCCQCGKAP